MFLNDINVLERKYATTRCANLLFRYLNLIRSSVCSPQRDRPVHPPDAAAAPTRVTEPPPSIQPPLAAPLGAALVALWSRWGLEATDQLMAVM